MGWAVEAKGYFSVDRKTVALLVDEAPSVAKLFQVIASQAFTCRIGVRQVQGGVFLYKEGSRPWGQRELGKLANLSINTVRRGLWRLERLGLIKYVTSKLGTIIEVLNFFRYKRQATGIHRDGDPFLTHRGDTRVSKVDHYRGVLKKISNNSVDLIAVATPPKDETPVLGKAGAALAKAFRFQTWGW